MSTMTKVSSMVDERAWQELKQHADDSGKKISFVLTEAVKDYLRHHRLRPEVERHLEDSINVNRKLYQRLAR